jgi:hypothetical protein
MKEDVLLSNSLYSNKLLWYSDESDGENKKFKRTESIFMFNGSLLCGPFHQCG